MLWLEKNVQSSLKIAGTTRDPVDELISFGGSTWRFIDTAGLRKRSNQQVELITTRLCAPKLRLNDAKLR
jgi:predicted GTPase